MQPERFGNLLADGVNGIKRSHRVLKDHRDVVAANGAHLFVRQLEQIFVIENYLAGYNLSRRRNQTHDGKRGDRFAAPRLTYQTQKLAAVETKTHVIDSTHQACARLKLCLKVFDLQKV